MKKSFVLFSVAGFLTGSILLYKGGYHDNADCIFFGTLFLIIGYALAFMSGFLMETDRNAWQSDQGTASWQQDANWWKNGEPPPTSTETPSQTHRTKRRSKGECKKYIRKRFQWKPKN